MIEIDVQPEHRRAIDWVKGLMEESSKQGLRHDKRYPRSTERRLADEVRGACAEIAVCRELGVPWQPRINTFHTLPDIDPDYEVRSIRLPGHCLIIRDDDILTRWFVLVLGNPPVVASVEPVMMQILGHIRGTDATQDCWRRDPHYLDRPCWMVPQSALIPAECYVAS